MALSKAKALQNAEKCVAQGKLGQAIKLYLEILDRDTSDVSLYNTVGDLYIRERNISEGLRQFQRLAEAYVQQGFNVKAIAIYRKISKIEPNSVEVLLKLAELYQLQGLGREAREQYLQAAEFFKKRNQGDRTIDVLRKLILLDPENTNFRNRLAAECEQAGKAGDAVVAYLESAEASIRHGDLGLADASLKKAADLEPKNSKVQLLRARLAMSRHEPQEVEKIVESVPGLADEPGGKQILLEAYLAARKFPQAEKLVMEVFRANPSDFTPISGFADLCLEKDDIETALQLLSGVSDQLIQMHNSGPLIESLRRVWTKSPQHIPTLQLLHRVCERAADELTLPEVLEALGQAYVDKGDLEKAEEVYQKLSDREPENEQFRGRLEDIIRKLGKEESPARPTDFAARDMALAPGPEVPAPIDDAQQAMVKEALDNSDLFARYNLVEKAVAELEKVLVVYPDQVEIHQRILEICHKGNPKRAVAAASALARISAAQGDEAALNRYEAIASGKSAFAEVGSPPPEVADANEEPVAAAEQEPIAASSIPPEPEATDTTAAVPASPVTDAETEEAASAASAEAAFDLTPPEAVSEPEGAPPPPLELDLSGDFEAIAGLSVEPAAPRVEEVIAPFEQIAPPIEDAPAPVEEPAAPIKDIAASGEEPSTPMEEVAAPGEMTTPPTEFPNMAELEEAATSIEVTPPAAETPAEFSIETPTFDFEDSKIEVDFYLENGFLDEARKTIANLEDKFPGNNLVAQLREHLDRQTGNEPGAEFAVELVDDAPEAPSVPEPPARGAPTQEDWDLPTGFAVPAEAPPPAESESPSPEPASSFESPGEKFYAPDPLTHVDENADIQGDSVIPSYAQEFMDAEPEPGAPNPPPDVPSPNPGTVPAGPAAVAGSGMDLLDDMAGDFASTLDRLAGPEESPPPPSTQAAPPRAPSQSGASQLSGLLAEMEDSGSGMASAHDPETHYNLGVAFREMGLLDEAIGEFQKVAKSARKGQFPPNFLQACSLLAICFMDKKMPAIAVKWYLRALQVPGLEDEATQALEYDLGVAYELSGDTRNALERYTEVYSQNIDFRDVAEKIRELQHKDR